MVSFQSSTKRSPLQLPSHHQHTTPHELPDDSYQTQQVCFRTVTVTSATSLQLCFSHYFCHQEPVCLATTTRRKPTGSKFVSSRSDLRYSHLETPESCFPLVLTLTQHDLHGDFFSPQACELTHYHSREFKHYTISMVRDVLRNPKVLARLLREMLG